MIYLSISGFKKISVIFMHLSSISDLSIEKNHFTDDCLDGCMPELIHRIKGIIGVIMLLSNFKGSAYRVEKKDSNK